MAALLPLVATAADQPLAGARFETQKELIFADFLVNGVKVNLVVDSGSSRCILDIEKAKQLGLNIDKVALTSGPHTVSGPIEVRIAEGVVYQLGDVRVTAPITVVYSLDFLTKRVGRQVDGIVGFRAFEAFVLDLDYLKHEIRVHRPDAFTEPANARAVPLEIGPSGLRVAGKIYPTLNSPAIDGEFGVDTGASGVDVVLWKPCAERKEIAAAARIDDTVDSISFGGERKAQQGRLGRLTVGEVVITDPTVRFTDVFSSGDVPSSLCGNLGSGFLGRFNAVFDFPHGKLWLAQ